LQCTPRDFGVWVIRNVGKGTGVEWAIDHRVLVERGISRDLGDVCGLPGGVDSACLHLLTAGGWVDT
jgi:hypothetical protein